MIHSLWLFFILILRMQPLMYFECLMVLYCLNIFWRTDWTCTQLLVELQFWHLCNKMFISCSRIYDNPTQTVGAKVFQDQSRERSVRKNISRCQQESFAGRFIFWVQYRFSWHLKMKVISITWKVILLTLLMSGLNLVVFLISNWFLLVSFEHHLSFDLICSSALLCCVVFIFLCFFLLNLFCVVELVLMFLSSLSFLFLCSTFLSSSRFLI